MTEGEREKKRTPKGRLKQSERKRGGGRRSRTWETKREDGSKKGREPDLPGFTNGRIRASRQEGGKSPFVQT